MIPPPRLSTITDQPVAIRKRLFALIANVLILLGAFSTQGAQSQLTQCIAKDNVSTGFCMPLMECPSLINIIKQYGNPIPRQVAEYVRQLRCPEEGFKDGWPLVCCPSKKPISRLDLKTTNTNSSSMPANTTPNPTTPDLMARSASEHRNLRLLPLNECGPILTNKISNGNATELFEFPWMALLQYRTTGLEDRRLFFGCGGSLISEMYVLTAAHCVTRLPRNMELVKVRLGEYDTATDTDCQDFLGDRVCSEPVQDFDVVERLPHLGFHNPRYANDIALIRLAKPANLRPESVRPVCLPVAESLLNFEPKRVTVTGWGLTEKMATATRLQQATMPTINRTECQRKYSRFTRIHESQLCAGGQRGVDSCRGDSGGPLVFAATLSERTLQMVQFGIVSLGRANCHPDTMMPGLYTRVAFYMNWILDNMHD